MPECARFKLGTSPPGAESREPTSEVIWKEADLVLRGAQSLHKTGHESTADLSENRPEAPPGQSESSRGKKLGFNSRLCTEHQQLIVVGLERGLWAQRIRHDLVSEQGFQGGHRRVLRDVMQLKARQPLPFQRLKPAAGLVAQVDFGQGAWAMGPDFKLVTTVGFDAIQCSGIVVRRYSSPPAVKQSQTTQSDQKIAACATRTKSKLWTGVGRIQSSRVRGTDQRRQPTDSRRFPTRAAFPRWNTRRAPRPGSSRDPGGG